MTFGLAWHEYFRVTCAKNSHKAPEQAWFDWIIWFYGHVINLTFQGFGFDFVVFFFHCNKEWLGSDLWGGKASAAELMMFDPITLCSIESYASVYSEKDKYIEMQPWQAWGQNGRESGTGSSIWSCI